MINGENFVKIALVYIKDDQLYSEKFQLLYKTKPYLREPLLGCIINIIPEISKSKYGNYIIREILECKEKDNIDKIFAKLKGHIKELILDNNGTFVIQKLIENVDEEKLKEILDEFIGNNDFWKIINSENEKRVFQECQ